MAVEVKPDRAPKQILDAFYGLAAYEDGARDAAALQLLVGLNKSENASAYCLKRLVKGLASPREAARLGFSVVLTELLKTTDSVSCDDLFALLEKYLPLKGAGENAKNNAIGLMLCLMALVRSQKCMRTLDKTVEKLALLQTSFPFLDAAAARAMISLSSLVDEDSFAASVWPVLKKLYNTSLDACTPSALWTMLELDNIHHKYIRKKAKLFRDGDWPPTDEKQLHRVGEILTTGVRSIPSGSHPLERSVLLAMMADQRLEAYWHHTVCGYLLKSDDKLVSSAGLRMIGIALSMQPSEQELKIILSSDTLKHLLKSLLDRRPAARFACSVAWDQLTAIGEYISSNKPNSALQFFVLKQILDVSFNFDGVSGSNLVHRAIGTLSSESAAMTADELISKLMAMKTTGKNDRRTQQREQARSSDVVVVVKLLQQLFEASQFSFASANGYRSKILRLLCLATYAKLDVTDLPPILSGAGLAEIVKNTFMRCFDLLCVVTTSQRIHKSKFDFPRESVVTMSGLIDTLVDRKRARLSDECRIRLKSEHEQLVAKAADAFHRLSKLTNKLNDDDQEGRERKGFLLFIGYMLLWFIADPDEYYQSLADLLVCYEKSQINDEDAESGPSWRDVLIDLMMGLMSRPHSYIRTPLQTAFHYFCVRLTIDHIRPLLKALKPSEKDNLVAEGESDPEENDAQSDVDADEGPNDGDHFEDQQSSGVESELEEDEVPGVAPIDGPVDPEFRRAVEDALGDAAVHSDTESTASDLTDEAMLKLDVSLASVFRSHLTRTSAKKSAHELAEQAQAFRMRCFDLVFVMLYSDPSLDVLTGVLLPLLTVANESVRTSDQKNVFNRSRQAIERIVQMKNTPAIPEEISVKFAAELSGLVKELVEFTRNTCTNPSVQFLASECLRFVLKLSDGLASEERGRMFENEVKRLFAGYLNEYSKDRQCLLPTSIFVTAFQKRPVFFVDNLPLLIESAFDETVRPFRRHECCELTRCLLNKDTLTNAKEKLEKKFASVWKRFVDHLHSGTEEVITKLEVSAKEKSGEQNSQPSSESQTAAAVKQSDVFEVLSVLRAVANLRDVVPLRKLEEHEFVGRLAKIADSPAMAQKTGRVARKSRRVKLRKLCLEIVKKLRPAATSADEEGAKNENAPPSSSSPPSKRRKANV